MIGIAISPANPQGAAAEVSKARSIPVMGAVVIAPLTQSWRNYGSVGGSLSLVSAPTITTSGALFDGSDDLATLASGTLSSFTLAARVKSNNPAATCNIIEHGTTIPFTAVGCGVEQRGGVFSLFAYGKGTTASTITIDTNEHSLVLTASTTSQALYIDGSLVASAVFAAVLTGAVTSLAGFTGTSYKFPGKIRNFTLLPRVLSGLEIGALWPWLES